MGTYLLARQYAELTLRLPVTLQQARTHNPVTFTHWPQVVRAKRLIRSKTGYPVSAWTTLILGQVYYVRQEHIAQCTVHKTIAQKRGAL
jgi:hypothetical protein